MGLSGYFLLFLDSGNHKVLPRWGKGHLASFVGGIDGLGEVVLPKESQGVESLLIQLLVLQVRSSSIRTPRNRNVAFLSADVACLNFCYILPEVDDWSLVWVVLRTMLLGAYSVERPDRKFRIQ